MSILGKEMLGTVQGCSELGKCSEAESRTRFLPFPQGTTAKSQTPDSRSERNPSCLSSVMAQDGTKPELDEEYFVLVHIHFITLFATEVSGWLSAAYL